MFSRRPFSLVTYRHASAYMVKITLLPEDPTFYRKNAMTTIFDGSGVSGFNLTLRDLMSTYVLGFEKFNSAYFSRRVTSRQRCLTWRVRGGYGYKLAKRLKYEILRVFPAGTRVSFDTPFGKPEVMGALLIVDLRGVSESTSLSQAQWYTEWLMREQVSF